MSNDEQIGSIAFRFPVSLAPWNGDVSLYAIEIEGKVEVTLDDDEDAPDEVAGSVKLIQFKLAEALADGAPLFWVLDTQAYESLYRKLFDDDGQFASRLDIGASYGDLLIIEELILDQRFDKGPLRHQVIEACIATFASVGVVLVRAETLRISREDWPSQGYVRIGHEDWLVRDNVEVRR